MSEIARLPDREPPSILNIIARAAFDDTFDVDKLRVLLEMQERFEARQIEREAAVALHSYNVAMGAAQADIKPVARDAYNSQTQSKYTRLETIDDAIRPIYTQHGFSLTYGTAAPVNPGWLRVTCRCAHRDGHTETYELEAPPDTTGIGGRRNKTDLHGMGSTISYLRRYLKMMIFDVVLVNEDDDGNAGGGNITNIATGAAENARTTERRETWHEKRDREAAEREREAADRAQAELLATQPKTVGEMIAKLALQISLADNAQAVDRLITSEDALKLREYVNTPDRDGNVRPSKAIFDKLIAETMLKWFPARPDADDPATDDPDRVVPRGGSDSV